MTSRYRVVNDDGSWLVAHCPGSGPLPPFNLKDALKREGPWVLVDHQIEPGTYHISTFETEQEALDFVARQEGSA